MERPGDYHLTRGGSLGVGFPGAVGAKLARPERLVVGFAGDGGSMYTYQALWTAARHGIDAKFVVCNNRKYRLLDDNIAQYWRERDIPEHGFPGSFDLSHPEIDFAGLARSLGAAWDARGEAGRGGRRRGPDAVPPRTVPRGRPDLTRALTQHGQEETACPPSGS